MAGCESQTITESAETLEFSANTPRSTILDGPAYDYIWFDQSLSSTNIEAAANGDNPTNWFTGVRRFEGDQPNALMGNVVATAGDVNGDGYSDVLVTLPGRDSGQENEGSVFLYLGSPIGLTIDRDWTFESNQANANLGMLSAATAGDLNGDGFSDVIVGVPAYDDGQINEGRAYIFLGSQAGLSNDPVFTISSNQAGSFFGFSVSTAGDVNGDGYHDVVIGAPKFDSSSENTGRIYLFLGESTGIQHSPAWTFYGDQRGQELGYSVATAGDINRDGFDDIAVSTISGIVLTFDGSETGLGTSISWESTHPAGVQIGCKVSPAGDINGDGYADIIVGVPGADSGGLDSGAARAYLGSPSGLSASPVWHMEGKSPDEEFGRSVANAGDVNGDGYSDVLVGAPGFSRDSRQLQWGAALLYLGSTSGLQSQPELRLIGEHVGSRSGQSVATAGDVDGDGLSDLIVGTPNFGREQIGEGRASVYLTSSGRAAPSMAWAAGSDQLGDWYGYSTANAGDINGDGYTDVIVGAPSHESENARGGMVAVYLGSGSGLGSDIHWSVEAAEEDALFGFSVAAAGDVNGDGFGDILVGAPDVYPSGKAYLWFGSESGIEADRSPESADWSAEGSGHRARFGHSVASAGDVDGDGYGDVVIGSPGLKADNIVTGAAYVYFGSPIGPRISADWAATGGQNESQFGWVVSSAGDVNGDGFSDILVGAPRFDVEYTDTGAVFGWYGGDRNQTGSLRRNGTGTLSDTDWQASGHQAFGRFGYSVSTAGDLNADGHSDVVVGVPYADGQGRRQTNVGAVFAYAGSNLGLGSSRIIEVTGDQLEAKLGWSVGVMHNFGASGMSALLAGAPFYDYLRSQNAGRVYIIPAEWEHEYPPSGSSLFPPIFEYMGLPSPPGIPEQPYLSGSPDPMPFQQFGFSVSPGGDIDGDGLPDIVVGAPFYDRRREVPGNVFAYHGNNLERTPEQLNVDNWGFIGPIGRSDGESSFRIALLARSAEGRARVKLEWEAQPVGDAFDGLDIQSGRTWDTGSPHQDGSVVRLVETVSELGAGSHYQWRVRIVSRSPYFPRSPWFTLSHNSQTEKNLRTGGEDNSRPQARFSASQSNGDVPFDVFFDAGESQDVDGEIIRYEWDFGDGDQAEGQSVAHNYRLAGNHIVSLRVIDNDGGENIATTSVITARAPDPIAVTIGPAGGAISGNYVSLWVPPGALQSDIGFVLQEQSSESGPFQISPKVTFGEPAWLLVKNAAGGLVKTIDSKSIVIPSVTTSIGIVAPLYSNSLFELVRQESTAPCPHDNCWLFEITAEDLPFECFDTLARVFDHYLNQRGLISNEPRTVAGMAAPMCQYPEHLDGSITAARNGTTVTIEIPRHKPTFVSHVYVPSKQWIRSLSLCSSAEADRIYSNIFAHEMGHVSINNATNYPEWEGTIELNGIPPFLSLDEVKRFGYVWDCERSYFRDNIEPRHTMYHMMHGVGTISPTDGVSGSCAACAPQSPTVETPSVVYRWELFGGGAGNAFQCFGIGAGDECLTTLVRVKRVNGDIDPIHFGNPCCWECEAGANACAVYRPDAFPGKIEYFSDSNPGATN